MKLRHMDLKLLLSIYYQTRSRKTGSLVYSGVSEYHKQGTWSERTRVQTPPDQNVPGSVKTYPGARRNVPAPT